MLGAGGAVSGGRDGKGASRRARAGSLRRSGYRIAGGKGVRRETETAQKLGSSGGAALGVTAPLELGDTAREGRREAARGTGRLGGLRRREGEREARAAPPQPRAGGLGARGADAARDLAVCAFPYLLAFTTDSIEIRLVVNGNLVHTAVLPQLQLVASRVSTPGTGPLSEGHQAVSSSQAPDDRTTCASQRQRRDGEDSSVGFSRVACGA